MIHMILAYVLSLSAIKHQFTWHAGSLLFAPPPHNLDTTSPSSMLDREASRLIPYPDIVLFLSKAARRYFFHINQFHMQRLLFFRELSQQMRLSLQIAKGSVTETANNCMYMHMYMHMYMYVCMYVCMYVYIDCKLVCPASD